MIEFPPTAGTSASGDFVPCFRAFCARKRLLVHCDANGYWNTGTAERAKLLFKRSVNCSLARFRSMASRSDAAGSGPPAAEFDKAIPKIIWIYWAQGWEHAPEVAQMCADSWTRSNPGWNVRLLSDADLPELGFPDWIHSKLKSYAAKSDILRIHLLANFGGVWADATTVCVRPLDSWLAAYGTSGFFAFRRPGWDRVLSSWFLCASPRHPLMIELDALVKRYWQAVRWADVYFWLHYLFEFMCRRNAYLAQLWDEVADFPADIPHALDRYVRSPAGQPDAALPGLVARAPLHKLDRHDAPDLSQYRAAIARFGVGQ